MSKTFRAGVTYFALVFGAGFLLGMVRVPLLVPRLGERWAELAEMPVMAVVIVVAAGHVLRRFPAVRTAARSAAVGLLALFLLVTAELGLALVIQDRSLGDYIASRDPVSGSVYVALLLVYAAMPWLRRRGVAGGGPGA
jgi:hypothetical protein